MLYFLFPDCLYFVWFVRLPSALSPLPLPSLPLSLARRLTQSPARTHTSTLIRSHVLRPTESEPQDTRLHHPQGQTTPQTAPLAQRGQLHVQGPPGADQTLPAAPRTRDERELAVAGPQDCHAEGERG